MHRQLLRHRNSRLADLSRCQRLPCHTDRNRLLWRRFLPRFERFSAAAAVLGLFAFTGLLIFAQLVWSGWQAREISTRRPRFTSRKSLRPPTLSASSGSYSTNSPTSSSTNAVSPASNYPPSINWPHNPPSLLKSVPRRVNTLATSSPPSSPVFPSTAVNVSARGLLLSLKDPSTGKWTPFQQHQTIFQDAIDAGYNTGIAGWYQPPTAASCPRSWTTASGPTANPLQQTCRLTAHSPSISSAPSAVSGSTPNISSVAAPVHPRMKRTATSVSTPADYRNLLTAGDAYLADPSVNFLFLHMPIPHPYGFYDRSKKTFSTKHTSYIDNLALADRYLAHVRQSSRTERPVGFLNHHRHGRPLLAHKLHLERFDDLDGRR